MPVPKSGKHSHFGSDDSAKALRRGAVILVIVLLLAGGLGLFLTWASQQRTELGADLCPTDPAFWPPKIIVLLFDETDKLTKQHQDWLDSYYRRLLHDEFESKEAQEKQRFSRFEVYSFRTSANGDLDLRRDLAICNPGGVTGLTKYTEHPDIVRKNFEEKFLERLNVQLRQLLDFKDSPRSPIFEALKEVGLKTLADPKYDRSEKLLIIASDMLHNTPELSLRKVQPTFEELYRTPYGNRLIADLKDATVRLLIFAGDSEPLQRTVTQRLWNPYFKAAGATRRSVKFVPNSSVE